MEEFDVLYDKERDTLTTQFAEKHKKMLAMSRFFFEAIKRYRQQGWYTHAEIWNIAFFLNIAAHDTSILVLQLANEREPWDRKLAARHVALAVYETAEDLAQLLGKPIRDAVQRLGLLNELDRELRQTRQPLDIYWQTYTPILKAIRLTSVAHREHDGITQFEVIDKIDVDQILELGLKFGDIQNQLGARLQALLNRTAKVRPPEMGSN
ncbi:MAG: hypothetical protein U0401_01490 [Anaerolineae bacterium]